MATRLFTYCSSTKYQAPSEVFLCVPPEMTPNSLSGFVSARLLSAVPKDAACGTHHCYYVQYNDNQLASFNNETSKADLPLTSGHVLGIIERTCFTEWVEGMSQIWFEGDFFFDCSDCPPVDCPECLAASWFLVDSGSGPLSSGSIDPGESSNITAPDAALSITDDDDTPLYSLSFLSGSTNTQVITDSTVSVQRTDTTEIQAVSVNAQGSATYAVPDSTVTVQRSDLSTIQAVTVQADDTDTYVVSDSTVTVQRSDLSTIQAVTVQADDTDTYVVSDSTVTVQRSDLSTIQAVSVQADDTDTYVVSDSTVNVTQSDATLIQAVSVQADDTDSYAVADSAVSNSDSSYTQSVKATDPLVLPDVDIDVNGSNVGTIVSVKDVEVNLVDEDANPVVPLDTNLTGNVLTLEVGQCAPEFIFYTIDTFSLTTPTYKWISACMGANGKIYAAPSVIGNTTSDNFGFLQIDPSDDSVTTFGGSDLFTKFGTTARFAFGQMISCSDDLIYVCPANAANIARITPSTNALEYSGSVNFTGGATSQRWFGIVEHGDFVYLIPGRNRHVSKVTKATWAASSIQDYGSNISGTTIDDYRWFGNAVKAPNNNIYCFPGKANTIFKLVPSTDTVSTVSVNFSLTSLVGDASAYAGAVLGDDGLIYAAPNTHPQLARLDPATDTLSYVYLGGHPNNLRDYGIPCLTDEGEVIFPPQSAAGALAMRVLTDLSVDYPIACRYQSNPRGRSQAYCAAIPSGNKIYLIPYMADKIGIIERVA